MFIVLLKFPSNKGQASQFMEGHKEWIKRGFNGSNAVLMTAYFCWSAIYSPTWVVESWHTTHRYQTFKAG